MATEEMMLTQGNLSQLTEKIRGKDKRRRRDVHAEHVSTSNINIIIKQVLYVNKFKTK